MLYIDDICYGASKLPEGELMQIKGYIMDLDFDDPVVEFRYYEGGNNGPNFKPSNNIETIKSAQVFTATSLSLSKKEKFYKVSLKGGFTNDDIPPITRLENNYPNPFNPETTIKFSLSTESMLRLDIYNIKGQRIKTLVNENMLPGRHEVVWNGLDDNNRTVASGIYFYRLRTKDYIQTRKIVLLK